MRSNHQARTKGEKQQHGILMCFSTSGYTLYSYVCHVQIDSCIIIHLHHGFEVIAVMPDDCSASCRAARCWACNPRTLHTQQDTCLLQ